MITLTDFIIMKLYYITLNNFIYLSALDIKGNIYFVIIK